MPKKALSKITVAKIIILFSGFSTANAQCTCSETLNWLLPALPYDGEACTTTTTTTSTTTFSSDTCEDELICLDLVGLCECETKGLREMVRKSCPVMCQLCTTTTTSTTTSTTTTSTTTTTTSTSTGLICEDKDVCPTKGGKCDCRDKCNHPLVGPRLQIECPVMCGTCGSTTTSTSTTTTTTTTLITTTVTFTTRTYGTCEDDPTCPTRSGKTCDCKEKCENDLVGPHLRALCPRMCNMCDTSTTSTTTTSTTTTSTSTTSTTTTSSYQAVCLDNEICPTLVDSFGVPLCQCDSIGDMVRASCPVMCDVCHKCDLPCVSNNLASKTSLIKAPNQNGTCYETEGIPKGHTCTLEPIVPVLQTTHVCLTGVIPLTCPGDHQTIAIPQKLQTHCQVCGGWMSPDGDIDPRAGFVGVKLTWGPNIFDGIITELNGGILGYEVYAVNGCGDRDGDMLARVNAVGIPQGIETCCNTSIYEATVFAQLPAGVKIMAFMVVPLTSIGPLDMGWVSFPVLDEDSVPAAPGAAVPAAIVSAEYVPKPPTTSAPTTKAPPPTTQVVQSETAGPELVQAEAEPTGTTPKANIASLALKPGVSIAVSLAVILALKAYRL